MDINPGLNPKLWHHIEHNFPHFLLQKLLKKHVYLMFFKFQMSVKSLFLILLFMEITVLLNCKVHSALKHHSALIFGLQFVVQSASPSVCLLYSWHNKLNNISTSLWHIISQCRKQFNQASKHLTITSSSHSLQIILLFFLVISHLRHFSFLSGWLYSRLLK